MGKVIAAYLVRVTLREPDDLTDPKLALEPPTIATLERAVLDAVNDWNPTDLGIHIAAERVDL